MGTQFGEACNGGIAWANTNPAVRSKVAPVVLKNPQIKPMQFQLTAALADGGGITQIYFADAVGLGTQLGLVGGANTQAMTGSPVTVASIKNQLFSRTLIISGFDFDCDNSAELQKNLLLPQSSIDGLSDSSKAIFSSRSRNNLQNNPDLLNIADGFVWDENTNLKMTTVANTTGSTVNYTFTFYVEACLAKGEVDAYLAARGAR